MKKNLLLKFRKIGLIMFLTSVCIFTFGQEYHFKYGFVDSLPSGWTDDGVFMSGQINEKWPEHYGGTKSAKIDMGEWLMTSKYYTAGTLSFWLMVDDPGAIGDVYIENGVIGEAGDTTWTKVWEIKTAEAYPVNSPDGGSENFRQHSVEINSSDTIVIRFSVDPDSPRKVKFDDVALTKMEVTDVKSLASELDVHFGPNPARGYVNIKMQESVSGKIALYNLSGKNVKSALLNRESEINMNVSDLTKGVYILSVEAGTKAYKSKLIIQ